MDPHGSWPPGPLSCGSDGRQSGRFDLPGTTTVTLALTCLVWALTTARGADWTDDRVLAALGAAVAPLAAFAAIELRRPEALIPPRLFTTGRVATGNLLMALLGSVWIALFLFLPLHRQQGLGSGPLATGAGRLPLAAAHMYGATLAPRLSRRFGATATVTVTGALLAEPWKALWNPRTVLTSTSAPHGHRQHRPPCRQRRLCARTLSYGAEVPNECRGGPSACRVGLLGFERLSGTWAVRGRVHTKGEKLVGKEKYGRVAATAGTGADTNVRAG